MKRALKRRSKVRKVVELESIAAPITRKGTPKKRLGRSIRRCGKSLTKGKTGAIDAEIKKLVKIKRKMISEKFIKYGNRKRKAISSKKGRLADSDKLIKKKRSRQVVLNNKQYRKRLDEAVKVVHPKTRKKSRNQNINKQSISTCKGVRTSKKKERDDAAYSKYPRMKERLMKIKIVPKRDIFMNEEDLEFSNIYRRVNNKIDNPSDEQAPLYNLRGSRMASKKRRRAQKNNSFSKKQSRKTPEKKQIILNNIFKREKTGKKKRKIEAVRRRDHQRQSQVDHDLELYKTQKNYFSTQSKGASGIITESDIEEDEINLYDVIKPEKNPPVRETKSTLNNLENRMIQGRVNGSPSRLVPLRLKKYLKSAKRRKKLTIDSDSIEIQLKKWKQSVKLKKKERSEMSNIGISSLEPSEELPPDQQNLIYRANKWDHRISNYESLNNNNLNLYGARLDNLGKDQQEIKMRKVESKMFYKQVSNIQFKSMNPEKIRAKEFRDIFNQIQDIRKMPAYQDSEENKQNVNKLQIYLGLHLLSKKIWNIGLWKTNRAFCFLMIRMRTETVQLEKKESDRRFNNRMINWHLKKKKKEVPHNGKTDSLSFSQGKYKMAGDSL